MSYERGFLWSVGVNISVKVRVGAASVYEIRAYQCVDLDESMAVLGIFGLDFTSQLVSITNNKRRLENSEWSSMATLSTVEFYWYYADIRFNDQCRALKTHIVFEKHRCNELDIYIIYRELIISMVL